jgi:hypothetical protein
MNQETREMVVSSIDDEGVAAAIEDGQKLSVDEAVALALEARHPS